MLHKWNSEFIVKKSTAVILLLATAALWSFGGVLIKLVDWNPIAIAGMRSAIAALFILIIIRRPKITWSFPQIGGALCYAATVILFVSANKLTTSANTILLQYTAPIYVALLGAWFLKERVKLSDWVTIFFVLAGIVLFFFDKLSTGGVYGNILAIVSGVTFAGTIIFMRSQKDTSPLESAFIGNVATAIIGLPFIFSSMPDLSSWIGLIILGVFQLGLSYILYSIAIKRVTALEAILIPVLEPILNPVWAFLFIGEKPGLWAFVGGIIVIATITIRCILPVIRHKPAIDENPDSSKA